MCCRTLTVWIWSWEGLPGKTRRHCTDQEEPNIQRSLTRSHRSSGQTPTCPEDTGADIELLNAAQFARHCKLQGPEDHAFLGCIKELVAASEAMLAARTDPQPPEYKRHEASLREEFKDILFDNIPPRACHRFADYVTAVSWNTPFP
jgi:hypothetical protein